MGKFRPILLTSFFFSVHLALVAYISSSVLAQFLSPKGISIVYALSSLASLFFLARASRIVEKWGAVRYAATVIALSALLLTILGFSHAHAVMVLVFIPYFALNALVLYGFDVFFEHFIRPKSIGTARGTYLSLSNIAWVASPVIVGMLESNYGFGVVYFFAAFAAITALLVLILGEQHYHDPTYAHVSLPRMFRMLRAKSDVRGSMIIAWLLQLFYVWMVIYSPLYLVGTFGFNWETIGIILSVMLLPFVLFEYPAGRIADRFSNERELIAGGFLIMAVATILFALASDMGALGIALILFLTRIGAAIVEVSNESYFFKHVTEKDAPTIAAFRNMVPLAYLAGPILAFLFLGWSVYSVLFFALGIIMLGGSAFALTLRDIKKE